MSRRVRLLSMLVPGLAALGLAISALTPTATVRAQDAEQYRFPGVALQVPQRLPAASHTSHAVKLPGRTLRFTATAGAIAIAGAERELLADVAYVAYALDGASSEARPVVFAYNGGPGSASTWLHLGALGPWRVPLTAEVIAGTASAEPIANAETWLDFADLVLIDPPGTGFSRLWPPGARPTAGEGAYSQVALPKVSVARRQQGGPAGRPGGGGRLGGGPEWFWSVGGDVATFAEFIAVWLEHNGRQAAPVVLVGESYGGFRTPMIARALADDHKVQVSALVLVSPVLDFDGRRGWRTPAHHAALLPSAAATHLEWRGIPPTREALGEAELYAGGDYVLELLRGPRDLAAIGRMAERIAPLTGLEPDAVRRLAGRLSIRSFIETSSVLKAAGAVSIYDAGMAGLEPVAGGRRGGMGEPFTGGLGAPLTAAMATLHRRLQWEPQRQYAMMAGEVNRRWRWPNTPGPPQVLGALHELHTSDAGLRTLVVHGFTDLVTPYFASVMQIGQMPAHGPVQRIAFEVYAGGHMFYSRDGSRIRFRADAAKLIAEALGARTPRPSTDRRETP